jgi:uncharacterized membrane protein YphA (DoxX/SURF4 family)
MLDILNVFPHLLTYSLLAPFILRITLGFVFLRFGGTLLSHRRTEATATAESIGIPGAPYAMLALGIIEIVVGIALIAGIYTQVAAIVAALVALKFIYWKLRGKPLGNEGILFDLLILAIAFSLVLSGAGLFAFDLPL